VRIFYPNASVRYPPTAGCGIHRYQQVKNWTELGHEVHTLRPDSNPFSRKHAKMPWSVVSQLRQADVMYCRFDAGPNPATDLTLPRTRWLFPERCAVVWEINVSQTYSLTRERPPAELKAAIDRLRRAAARVDAAVCVTKMLADEARDLLGIEHAFVVQNGSDPEIFRRDLPLPAGFSTRSNRLHVAFIGSGVETYHDLPLIGQLAGRVDERSLPIDLHVFGKSAQYFADRKHACLFAHGPVSYLELPKYLAAMDVGLVLYQIRADGLSPLKLFDYLASGAVPIGSESQPIHEVLDGTGAGLVGTWSVDTLTDALISLQRDPQRLHAMRDAGRQLILDNYSWRRISEKTAQIMQEAIDQRRRVSLAV
jgi:glycosyltransferase involved in cell wall biosynthesis